MLTSDLYKMATPTTEMLRNEKKSELVRVYVNAKIGRDPFLAISISHLVLLTCLTFDFSRFHFLHLPPYFSCPALCPSLTFFSIFPLRFSL